MPGREQFGADFIYDAAQKKAILWGKTENGAEVRLELIRRNDDDSHDAVLMLGKNENNTNFVLREDEIEYLTGGIRLKQPAVKILVDDVSAAKFRGFTKGNIPTPDIPSDSLP